MKKFKELKKGDKIYTFVEDVINEYTVIGTKVDETHFRYYNDNDIRRVFVVNTEELSIESRTSKGKTLKNENKKRLPEKAYRVN